MPGRLTISAFDTPSLKHFSLDRLRSMPANLPEDDDAFAFDPNWGFLVRPAWVASMFHEYGGEHSAMFQARCLGNFPTAGGDDSLLGLTDVEAAIAKWKSESATDTGEPIIFGVDVARFGNCSTVVTIRQGGRIVDIQSWKGADLMNTVGRVKLLAERYHPLEIYVDDSGLGGGVTDRLQELGLPARAVLVGRAARDSKAFANLKCEITWHARGMIRGGLLSIPPNPQLIADLTALRYSLTSSAQLKVEDKASLVARGVPSPDFADSLFLACMESDGPTALYEYFKSRQEQATPGPRSGARQQPVAAQGVEQDIPPKTPEDEERERRWWQAPMGVPNPPPPGFRVIREPGKPIGLQWVGREAEPGLEWLQLNDPETFEQIGREQSSAMVRDGDMPASMVRHFPDPSRMNPRIGWRGQGGSGANLIRQYQTAQARYGGFCNPYDALKVK